jgi:hypothetical protein
VIEVCTCCGDKAVVCIPADESYPGLWDYLNGPYALCKKGYKMWRKMGHSVLYYHS